MVELQTGSPTKIKISGYSYNQNALEMEQWLHAKFHSKRLEGEWFALNDDDVAIIHHHFETYYLDEYLAPLSKRAIEINRKEKEKTEIKAALMTIEAEKMKAEEEAKIKKEEAERKAEIEKEEAEIEKIKAEEAERIKEKNKKKREARETAAREVKEAEERKRRGILNTINPRKQKVHLGKKEETKVAPWDPYWLG